jgi:hypothetical protein
MENYVWRLEFQGNGNVHYHICTDVYIDYFLAQKIWNRIINKLGYVQAYKEKFSKMTLNEYYTAVKYSDHVDFNQLAKRYAKGKAENWENPPSVDVKVCTSNKAISFYISKYFSKKESEQTACNRLDNEENSFSLRLWFCSRSLSKLTSICEYKEHAPIDWFHVLRGVQKVREVVLDYAICLFFDVRDMANDIKAELYKAFRKYAIDSGYTSAGSLSVDYHPLE